MDRGNFKRDKLKIFLSCGCYSFICEVISLVLLGFDKGILIGLVAGTLCVIVNLVFLEVVVDLAIINKNISLAFLLQLGRLFIYGGAGFMCFRMLGTRALIAFGVATLGVVIGAALTYGKEGNNG